MSEDIFEELRDIDIDDPEFFRLLKFDMEQRLWDLRKELSSGKYNKEQIELLHIVTKKQMDREIEQMSMLDNIIEPDETEIEFRRYVEDWSFRLMQLFEKY